MKASFKPENTGSIEYTATITMPLSQWIDVRKALAAHQWTRTNYEFSEAIDEIVRKAENNWHVEGV